MATGTAEHIDATTAAVFIRPQYSLEALVAREQRLLMANRVWRALEKDMTHGGSVLIPNISNLSVTAKNMSSNAATAYETITETDSTLTVGTWEYSAIALETATGKQADRDLLEKYAPKMGYALAQAVDDGIHTLAAAVSGQSVGALLSPLTYDNMLRARQYLFDANVPLEDRFIAVSPAQEAEFMKLDQFIHSDYDSVHGTAGNQRSGEAFIGSWLKMPVYVSTNVDGSNAAGHSNVMWQREAFALVVQMNPTSHHMFDINYFAQKVTLEQLRGNATLRADHAVRLQGL